MTSLRRSAGVLAALVSLGTVVIAPGAVAAPANDPAATTVTGNCSGGAGRVTVSVTPSATEGMYNVQATARRLRDGTRWKVRIDTLTGRGPSVDFGRQVVDGGWTVRAQVAAARRGQTLVNVIAVERGNQQHDCDLLNSPSFDLGITTCNNPRQQVALLSRERDDGSTALRLFVVNAPRESRWHLMLTATGSDAARQVVEYNDVAGKGGLVRSRVTVQGVGNPRLRLVASRVGAGGRCVIGLNPANVTTAPASGVGRLLKAL